MSEPLLSFLYNTSTEDLPYEGLGGSYGTWRVIELSTENESVPDRKIYTGGGINNLLPIPTAPYGRREATLKPLTGSFPIPQIYIESTNDLLMYNIPLASNSPNTNRYVFGVYIDGTINSDLYLEMWDDLTLSTSSCTTLSGSLSAPYSVFNAISTTNSAPESNWSGISTEGAICLAGYSNRLRLKNADLIQNETVYYNMYALIPFDLDFTHDQPIETYRYLYS